MVKKQTAAEKYDLVPPWCVVKKGDQWFGVEHVGGDFSVYERNGSVEWYPEPVVVGDWGKAEARRVARRTRPLDSWEPAGDCALPVGGWWVGTNSDGVVRLFDGGSLVIGSPDSFPTRRAAYIWAWTEALAPDEAKEDRVEQVTDGKGRTDEVIDAGLDEVIAAINTQAHTLRLIRKRLAAGTVGKPATLNTRHDAASANELATAVEASRPTHKWGCKVGKARNGWWLVTDAMGRYWMQCNMLWAESRDPETNWQTGNCNTEAEALALLARATTPPPTYTPPVDDAATERAAVLARIPSRYVMPGASLADAVGNMAAACDAALLDRDEWKRRAQEAEATLRDVRDWIAGKVN